MRWVKRAESPAALLRHFAGSRAGNAAVEFGLILPVVVVMLGGLIEFGLVANERTALETSARAGAQFALQQGFDQTGIQNTVTAASNVVVTAQDIVASQFYECSDSWGTTVAAGTQCASTAALAQFVTVRVTKSYTPFMPFLGFVVPTQLQGSATVRVP